MTRTIVTVAAMALMLAACGDRGGSAAANNSTIGQRSQAENEVGALPADANGMAAPGTLGNASGPQASTGAEYVALAGGSDLYEIEAARIAAEKASSGDVKSLAEMILRDHERSTAELRTAAGQADPAIPVAPQMNAEQRTMIEQLRATPAGTSFDNVYLQQQATAHQKALDLVNHYAVNGDVPSLQRHAQTVSGPIQQHLTRVRELATRPAG